MLLSMTGYGESRRELDALTVSVEVRSVNNRYLKVSTRLPDAYSAFESEVDRVVRKSVTRGTVNVTIRASLSRTAVVTQIDPAVVTNYWQQASAISDSIGVSPPADISSLLSLPNVLSEGADTTQALREHWSTAKEVVAEAIANLNEFRVTEGQSMANDLKTQCETIEAELQTIIARAPEVVSDYRKKLVDRVREMLSDSSASVEESDLIREVSIFSDRCDINEEIKRLQSHIEQFDAFLQQEASQGRKLEFLVQEMFRETNTIGSKANDVGIAHSVVEMKAAIEKMREMLQNIE